MKAMKKIVLLLLCLAMVLGMAACGGNATTETKSETTTTAPETSETASETTADPANTTYQAGFDAPENFFRVDPYDSQCGEMETEERGLQDGEFDSVQEITEFSVQ